MTERNELTARRKKPPPPWRPGLNLTGQTCIARPTRPYRMAERTVRHLSNLPGRPSLAQPSYNSLRAEGTGRTEPDMSRPAGANIMGDTTDRPACDRVARSPTDRSIETKRPKDKTNRGAPGTHPKWPRFLSPSYRCTCQRRSDGTHASWAPSAGGKGFRAAKMPSPSPSLLRVVTLPKRQLLCTSG